MKVSKLFVRDRCNTVFADLMIDDEKSVYCKTILEIENLILHFRRRHRPTKMILLTFKQTSFTIIITGCPNLTLLRDWVLKNSVRKNGFFLFPPKSTKQMK